MATYQYRSEAGATIERTYRMAEPKPQVIEEAGVAYHRVYGDCQINADPVSQRYPVISRSAPRGPRGLKGWDKRGGWDKKGRPIIRSAEDHRALEQEHGLVRG